MTKHYGFDETDDLGWTLKEIWAFAKCDEDGSDNSGPDEDMMRNWLSKHEHEYPGDELARKMTARGDFNGWRKDDPDTPAEILPFDREIGIIEP